MTGHPNSEQTGNLPFLRKIGWTALAGFVTFATSALLGNVLHVSLADQLVLSFIIGGATLLVQYLAEFEGRITAFEAYQRSVLAELDTTIHRGFAGANEATELWEEIAKSTLHQERLKQVVRRAGRFTDLTSPLIRKLANSEVERLSGTLQSLAGAHELFYDGEDREYLLALTRNASKSILATSWTTLNELEVGFWLTDLGARYLDLQHAALGRNVSIRRVFIFESPDLMSTAQVKRILAMQRSIGVEIRLLGVGPVPPDGSIADFVIFDGEISHETAPVTRRDESGALTTRLVLDQDVVNTRMLRFEMLWREAITPDQVRAAP